MVIGAFVRGLSMRDVESLCEKAGLGKLSKSTASRICQELRDRFEAFKRRDLYDVQVAALFLDAGWIRDRLTLRVTKGSTPSPSASSARARAARS
jgi:transposase-like protein